MGERFKGWSASLMKTGSKTGLTGDLIAVFRYLKGVHKHEGNQLFTRVGSDGTRGNGFKIKGNLDQISE